MKIHRNQKENENLEIWQWNCRSIRKKKPSLEQYIEASVIKPDIICLQEAGNKTNIKGYTAIIATPDLRVATYVKKDITTIHHTLLTVQPSATLIEVVPNKRWKKSVFVLNVYSSPSKKDECFEDLLWESSKIVRNNKIIITGDFNAPHKEWGYQRNSGKGEGLLRAIEQIGLIYINDPTNPARSGNEHSRDTCPDLTFTKETENDITWTNTQETLGSDHNIISIAVLATKFRKPLGVAKLTDWKKYRDSM